jgi:hypothetical protein
MLKVVLVKFNVALRACVEALKGHNSLQRKNDGGIKYRKTNVFVLRHGQTNCCMLHSGSDRKGGHDVSRC